MIMNASIEFTFDISNDPYFVHLKGDTIPKDCSVLKIVGKLLKIDISRNTPVLVGNTALHTYGLNTILKTRTNLRVLDLSGCTDVTKIYNGFSNLSIETIILPPNVKDLPFISYCSNLLSIIGHGLTKIGNITECPLLENLVFNESLTEIQVPNTNIRKISIPSVKEITFRAFENCTNLEEIEFSPNLKIIKAEAFKNCTNLYKINIPDLCEIEQAAFDGCTSLRYLYLPKTIKQLNQNVFANCINLEFIIGGESIQEVCSGAFLNCKKLKRIPFSPEYIDDDTFDKISNNHYGVILSTYTTSIIWCFDTLSFFYCNRIIENEKLYSLVKFSKERRFTFSKLKDRIDINYNPCQIAIDVCSDFNIDEDYSINHWNFSWLYIIREGIEAYHATFDKIPKISSLYESIKEKVSKLDIETIIKGYSTSVSQSQTWKVGGDNTFHSHKKTSFVYTDAYLEQFLPIYDEDYHESGCQNYSDEIDNEIQAKQDIIDASLKTRAISAYNQTDHINTLIDFYIRSYIEKNSKVQDILHIDLAINILRYYFNHLSRHLNSYKNLSLSILCSGETPPLNYQDWLRKRYATIFRNI